MTQRGRCWTAGMLMLAMVGSGTWAAPAVPAFGAVVTVADDRAKVALDYERGFADGLNGRDERERDRSYRDGYRDGRNKHRSNGLRPDGKDYARGYRDGFNEGKAADTKNKAYAAGHSAGQGDRGKLSSRVAAVSPAPANVDNMIGRPAAQIDKDMKSLGFIRISQFKQGRESFTTWQSRAQNRCVRLTSREGRVKDLTNLDNDRCT